MTRQRFGCIAGLLFLVVGSSAGCASKKFVRNEISGLSGHVDSRIDSVEGNVREVSDQAGEATRLGRENTAQIRTTNADLETTRGNLRSVEGNLRAAETSLRTTDQKATGAMEVAETAQAMAGRADLKADALRADFQSRSNYKIAAESVVNFAFDSARLDANFHVMLQDIARQLKADPEAVLVLEGHTDSVGDAEYNFQLGQRRLEAVLRYLVVEQDVPIQRIYQMSLGKARPISAEATPDGRKKNRAAVVRLLTPNIQVRAGG